MKKTNNKDRWESTNRNTDLIFEPLGVFFLRDPHTYLTRLLYFTSHQFYPGIHLVLFFILFISFFLFFISAILHFMYNFAKTRVTYITITTYKLQITIPINIAYDTNNITTILLIGTKKIIIIQLTDTILLLLLIYTILTTDESKYERKKKRKNVGPWNTKLKLFK